jgi:polysaccharide biosynthesis protein PslJ
VARAAEQAPPSPDVVGGGVRAPRPDGMPSVDGSHRRGTAGRQVAAAILIAAIAIVGILTLPPLAAGAVLLLVAVLYLARRLVFTWVGGLAILVAVVMFIPVRRYAIPIPLPFQLEPYRVVLVVLLVAVLGAVLFGRRAWQPVAFGWPIGIFVAALTISVIANGPSLVKDGLASTALGALVNYLVLLSTFYIVRQLVTTEGIAFGLVTALVWCGAIVAFLAVVERVTRVNVFWKLGTFLPLTLLAPDDSTFRAGGYRSYASAQHPIALSVMLAMLIPLAIYLAKYGRRPFNEISRRIVYGIVVVVLIMGILTAVSRTAVVVMGVMLLLALLLRPWLGITLLALGLPGMVLGGLLVPKVFTTVFASFLDINSLVASQEMSVGMTGQGRIADLGPAFAIVVQHPFFGTGVGSRIVVGQDANSFILDNQWLGTLMDAGAVGVIGLIALTVVPAIMLIAYAFTTAKDAPRYALLAFACATSIAGYTAALFFYDAFGFYQTFFVLCFVLAVGAWLLTASPPAVSRRAEKAARATRGMVPTSSTGGGIG